MNKAKIRLGKLTQETQKYLNEVKRVTQSRNEGKTLSIHTLDSNVPERVDIKRAIPGRYFPEDYEENFAELWRGIRNYMDN